VAGLEAAVTRRRLGALGLLTIALASCILADARGYVAYVRNTSPSPVIVRLSGIAVQVDDSPSTARVIVPPDGSWWLTPFVDLERSDDTFVPGHIEIRSATDCLVIAEWSVGPGDYEIKVGQRDATLESVTFGRPSDASDAEPADGPDACADT
jgi:hypothetical protein